jgi:hypothetical protein
METRIIATYNIPMGKKCIPGVLCVENMTLFLVVVIGIMVAYLYYRVGSMPMASERQTIVVASQMSGGDSRTLDSPYLPPEKIDAPYVRDIRGPVVPVNVKTRSANLAYSQVGILTKNDKSGASAGNALILPLMGRNLWNGRDKWQYYTMSNGAGMFSAKLPVSVNGRSCSGEYGCDSISSGDVVYVEGYNDTFRATIYETAGLQYLPV